MTPPKFVALDRDGTIIVERQYLSFPDQVELLPGVAAGLRAMRGLGLGLGIPGTRYQFFTETNIASPDSWGIGGGNRSSDKRRNGGLVGGGVSEAIRRRRRSENGVLGSHLNGHFPGFSPAFTHHSLTVSSSPLNATILPSGLKAPLTKSSVGTSSVAVFLPVAKSQSFVLPQTPTEIIVLPSELKAKQATPHGLCPARVAVFLAEVTSQTVMPAMMPL